ncbi:hypothetical protein RFX75_10705, partial [Acinetobacter baumannii]|nr:hypothetical protein [Acinetobacter baumannii]
MKVMMRSYEPTDARAAVTVWNEVVEDGVAFPQLELLTPEEGNAFFLEQSFTGIAEDEESGEIVGLYIL